MNFLDILKNCHGTRRADQPISIPKQILFIKNVQYVYEILSYERFIEYNQSSEARVIKGAVGGRLVNREIEGERDGYIRKMESI